MYEKFYGLSVDPFRLSPDHRFSFSHSSYAKAKSYIQYALHRAEGFVMITGKPGTGKTTLVNEVLHGLSRTEVVVATLVSTQLEADDLLRMVAFLFGLDGNAPHKASVLQRLMDFLVRQHRDGRRALLIIDEAQDLSVSALEELRLLTNLHSVGQPLLQIILLGQESLRDLVRRPNLEQVHQRLVAACDLEPLGVIDTLAYVQHRLERAGWRGDPTIKRDVWPILYEFSGGVPRRINLVCSRLLLHGCVEERHTLTAKDAASVATELQQEELAPMEPGVDGEPPLTGMAAGRQSNRKGGETRDQGQEESGGRANKDSRRISTERFSAYVGEDIAWNSDVWRDIGDMTREPASAKEAGPAVVGDPQRSPASTEGERPDSGSSPNGQRAMEYTATEECGPHGRTRSQDGLSGENHGSRGAPEDGAVHMADANGDESLCERESGALATDWVLDEGPKGNGARRTWPMIASVAVVLIALVGAAFYFRPTALERELAWIEQRTASIPQKARALFVRLTGLDSNRGQEHQYEQPGRGGSEGARAGVRPDQDVAAGGGSVTRPASQNGGGRGAVGEALAGSTGAARPVQHSGTEEVLEDRRSATAVPTDASRGNEE